MPKLHRRSLILLALVGIPIIDTTIGALTGIFINYPDKGDQAWIVFAVIFLLSAIPASIVGLVLGLVTSRLTRGKNPTYSLLAYAIPGLVGLIFVINAAIQSLADPSSWHIG